MVDLNQLKYHNDEIEELVDGRPTRFEVSTMSADESEE